MVNLEGIELNRVEPVENGFDLHVTGGIINVRSKENIKIINDCNKYAGEWNEKERLSYIRFMLLNSN